MNPTPPPESPALEDIAAAGARRLRDADRLKKSSDELKELVLAALRAGVYKPTEVAKTSGWTGAHVRKMAREAGIEPDDRYKERAERLRKAQTEEPK
ncbi:hypothetical protein [Streptomyces sp. NBC_01789]|uniref:hypothetical protein n=1 Tax=Streptomyces sp. NBC_01789 TaxID=2975941 RepID=UPI0022500AEC|nr:hypothetical protein [Streptomyces sp. NBC_01789]MCX4450680.1 hypothetical protein [Streptomyces sp. NBC_01789]